MPSTAFHYHSRKSPQIWQWKRIPFGLSNVVPAFQRVIDDIIKENDCKGTIAYLDNITVGGKTQEEHNKNLAKFFKVASDCNLTFNEAKRSYSTQSVKLLGYQITKNCLKPDPDRVKTLLALPARTSNKAATYCWLICLLRSMDTTVFRQNKATDSKLCLSVS